MWRSRGRRAVLRCVCGVCYCLSAVTLVLPGSSIHPRPGGTSSSVCVHVLLRLCPLLCVYFCSALVKRLWRTAALASRDVAVRLNTGGGRKKRGSPQSFCWLMPTSVLRLSSFGLKRCDFRPASSLASGFLPFNVLTVKYRLCFPPQPRWTFDRTNQNGSRG